MIALGDYIADTGTATQPGAPNLLDDHGEITTPVPTEDSFELDELAIGPSTPTEWSDSETFFAETVGDGCSSS